MPKTMVLTTAHSVGVIPGDVVVISGVRHVCVNIQDRCAIVVREGTWYERAWWWMKDTVARRRNR